MLDQWWPADVFYCPAAIGFYESRQFHRMASSPIMGEMGLLTIGGTGMSTSSVIRLIVACATSLSAGLIGSVVVAGSFTTWYSTIEKPAFTPPSWVFGPVWTILYLLMGIAAFLVWQKGLRVPAVRVALAWFLVQLGLNALWTPVFFGLHRIELALVVILLLWAAIAITTCYFLKISRVAAGLLVPYLLWVSFATVLNASIWHLNR
jgi:benzodiazapine receptor